MQDSVVELPHARAFLEFCRASGAPPDCLEEVCRLYAGAPEGLGQGRRAW